MANTPSQKQFLNNLSIILSTLGLISCLIIIIIWLKFKELRKLGYSLIVFAAIPTGIRQIGKMFGGLPTGHFLCSFQGYLLTTYSVSSFWWICTIALIMVSDNMYTYTGIYTYIKL